MTINSNVKGRKFEKLLIKIQSDFSEILGQVLSSKSEEKGLEVIVNGNEVKITGRGKNPEFSITRTVVLVN